MTAYTAMQICEEMNLNIVHYQFIPRTLYLFKSPMSQLYWAVPQPFSDETTSSHLLISCMHWCCPRAMMLQWLSPFGEEISWTTQKSVKSSPFLSVTPFKDLTMTSLFSILLALSSTWMIALSNSECATLNFLTRTDLHLKYPTLSIFRLTSPLQPISVVSRSHTLETHCSNVSATLRSTKPSTINGTTPTISSITSDTTASKLASLPPRELAWPSPTIRR